MNDRTADTPQQHRSRVARSIELRRAIEAGVAALDRGEYTEVEDADLDAYLDGLAASESR